MENDKETNVYTVYKEMLVKWTPVEKQAHNTLRECSGHLQSLSVTKDNSNH